MNRLFFDELELAIECKKFGEWCYRVWGDGCSQCFSVPKEILLPCFCNTAKRILTRKGNRLVHACGQTVWQKLHTADYSGDTTWWRWVDKIANKAHRIYMVPHVINDLSCNCKRRPFRKQRHWKLSFVLSSGSRSIWDDLEPGGELVVEKEGTHLICGRCGKNVASLK